MKKKILSVLLILAIFAIPAFSEVDIYGFYGPALFNTEEYMPDWVGAVGAGVNYEMNTDTVNWLIGGRFEVTRMVSIQLLALETGIGKNFSVSENSLIDLQAKFAFGLVNFLTANITDFTVLAQWEHKTRSLPAVGVGLQVGWFIAHDDPSYYAVTVSVPVYVTWTIKTKSDKALYE